MAEAMRRMARRAWGPPKPTGATRVVVSHPYTRGPSDPSPFVDNRISNTKYTLLSFIPLNLWQQCSQHMNRYFLLIALLQLWAAITPVAPITTWGPLFVIFAISGLKEAIDDTRRYRADQLANERPLAVLRDGAWRTVASQDILVGDLVRLEENEEIPADMLLLQSAESVSGSAYIQTSNLDGETNLKQRYTAHLAELQPLTQRELAELNIKVECAHPNNEVYGFNSTLELPHDWRWHAPVAQQGAAGAAAAVDGGNGGAAAGALSKSASGPRPRHFPLTSLNLLLQATFLRNTAWVVGMVIYTGNETKVGCNKQRPRPKYTKLDEKINKTTLLVFAFQICLIVIWGIVGSLREKSHKHAASDGHVADRDGWNPAPSSANSLWYLAYGAPSSASSATEVPGWVGPLIIPLRFLLLASMMIPISLKVSLDVIKLYYSCLINWDLNLAFWDPAAKPGDGPIHAKASNTSIAENLGQVRYVLSDKTGTFTENVMVFRKMCAGTGGIKYGEEQHQQQQECAGGQKQQQQQQQGEGKARPRAGSASSRMASPSTDSCIPGGVSSSAGSGSLASASGAGAGSASSAAPPPRVDRRLSIKSGSDGHAAVAASILADPVLLRGLADREPSLLFLLKSMSLCNTVVPSYVDLPDVAKDSSRGAGASLSPRGGSVRMPIPSGVPSHLASSSSIPIERGGHGHSLSTTALVPGTGRSLEMVHSEKEVGGRFMGGVGGGGMGGSVRVGSPGALLSSGRQSPSINDAGSVDVHVSSHSSYPSRAPYLLGGGGLGSLESDQPALESPSMRRGTVAAFPPPTTGIPAPRRGVHYASSSPDELSLVEFASQAGLKLLEKNGNVLRISIDPRVELGGGAGAGAAGGNAAFVSAAGSPSAQVEEWEVLHVLEFSSERKRMSVLLRQVGGTDAGAESGSPKAPASPSASGAGAGAGSEGASSPAADGRILLLCKGADDVIFQRLESSDQNTAAMAHVRVALDEYASQGLRTLCFSYRWLSASEFATFDARMHAASLDIHHRERSLLAAYETVEKQLLLSGCTGIEDKLQEGVGRAIQTLREAGIKVWMLTGDKFQTALEISKSCELYKPKESPLGSVGGGARGAGSHHPHLAHGHHHHDGGDTLYTIEGSNDDSVRDCVRSIIARALDSNHVALHPYCLIIDGSTLTRALGPGVEHSFALLALQAVSCICCRTTPAQKAAMVSMVRKHSKLPGMGGGDFDAEDEAELDSHPAVQHARSASGQVAADFTSPLGLGLGGASSDLFDAEGGNPPMGVALGNVGARGGSLRSGMLLRSSSRSTSSRRLAASGAALRPSWFVRNLPSLFSPPGAVVLAIGDGGNDVAMLQEADVGVGIVGKEGLQAARAADFSFSRFSALTTLLLLHGRYSYNRTAFIAQYCFYKSALICFVQLYFAFLSEFSGASYFDSYSLVTYNLFYTSLPTILFVLEQDLSPLMLRHNPALYGTSQRGTRFTARSMGGWMLRAAVQAILLISFASATHHGDVGTGAFGQQGQISNALAIYTACVLIHPITLALESSYLTLLHLLVLVGTVVVFIATNLLLAHMSKAMDLWHVYTTLFSDGEYVPRCIVLTTACIVPVLVVKYLRQRYWPSLVQIAHEADLKYHASHPHAAEDMYRTRSPNGTHASSMLPAHSAASSSSSASSHPPVGMGPSPLR